MKGLHSPFPRRLVGGTPAGNTPTLLLEPGHRVTVGQLPLREVLSALHTPEDPNLRGGLVRPYWPLFYSRGLASPSASARRPLLLHPFVIGLISLVLRPRRIRQGKQVPPMAVPRTSLGVHLHHCLVPPPAKIRIFPSSRQLPLVISGRQASSLRPQPLPDRKGSVRQALGGTTARHTCCPPGGLRRTKPRWEWRAVRHCLPRSLGGSCGRSCCCGCMGGWCRSWLRCSSRPRPLGVLRSSGWGRHSLHGSCCFSSSHCLSGSLRRARRNPLRSTCLCGRALCA